MGASPASQLRLLDLIADANVWPRLQQRVYKEYHGGLSLPIVTAMSCRSPPSVSENPASKFEPHAGGLVGPCSTAFVPCTRQCNGCSTTDRASNRLKDFFSEKLAFDVIDVPLSSHCPGTDGKMDEDWLIATGCGQAGAGNPGCSCLALEIRAGGPGSWHRSSFQH